VEKQSHHTPDNTAMPCITIPRHPLRAGMKNPAGLFVMLAFPNMMDLMRPMAKRESARGLLQSHDGFVTIA
jgi:hypothetical protein